MKAEHFVFEKVKDETTLSPGANPILYRLTANPDTRSDLREYLNAQLKDGFDAKDFFIIRGREEKITAVKVVAELETVES